MSVSRGARPTRAHALLFAAREYNSPVTAEEVVLYDEESSGATQTSAALRSAQRVGLAVFVPGDRETPSCWVPTQAALGLRSLLEDRYLRETGEAE